MKLHEVGSPHPPAAGRQPFRALLEEATNSGPQTPPPLPPRPALSLVPPARRPSGARPALTAASSPALRPVLVPVMRDAEARRAAEVASVARARVESEADRLHDVRVQHDATAERGTTFRRELVSDDARSASHEVVELLVKELLVELASPPAAGGSRSPLTMSMTPAPVPGATSGTGRPPEAAAEHAVALIEKIEVFVRSQRPALQLTLNNSLGARVEIERLGPGQVALKLVGRDGPPSADAISRIREELRERGLRVAALSVA